MDIYYYYYYYMFEFFSAARYKNQNHKLQRSIVLATVAVSKMPLHFKSCFIHSAIYRLRITSKGWTSLRFAIYLSRHISEDPLHHLQTAIHCILLHVRYL